MGDPRSYLKKGAEIEISSNIPEFQGSWYVGKFLRRSRAKNKNMVLVEYATVMHEHEHEHEHENKTTPYREELDIVMLRPAAPRESTKSFSFSQQVDAYFDDGWWEGVITKVNNGVYTVYLRGMREELKFRAEELRVHRDWVNGVWIPPLKNHEACAGHDSKEELGRNGKMDEIQKPERQEEPKKNWERNGKMDGIQKPERREEPKKSCERNGEMDGSRKPNVHGGSAELEFTYRCLKHPTHKQPRRPKSWLSCFFGFKPQSWWCFGCKSARGYEKIRECDDESW